MPSARAVTDIIAALSLREIPTITTWNRLEGRPRTQQFERALQAEVRDALWMLTKQWQMGEFNGSDAGSPVFAKVLMQTTRLTKFQPAGGKPELFDSTVPLETKVERRSVPLHRQKRILSLDVRLVMARQWFALIANVADYRDAFIGASPILQPDPTEPWMGARSMSTSLLTQATIPMTALASSPVVTMERWKIGRGSFWRGSRVSSVSLPVTTTHGCRKISSISSPHRLPYRMAMSKF